MLFSLPGYFVWLFFLVLAYWGLRGNSNGRYLLLACAGLGSVGYLLYWNLPTSIGIAILASMLGLSAASYGFAIGQIRSRSRKRLHLALLLPFSLYAIVHIASLPHRVTDGPSLILPVSIGFFVLRQMHGVYECYRGSITGMTWQAWTAYVFFLPTVIAGPLERFPHFEKQISTSFAWKCASLATENLVIGAFKKFVMADLFVSAFLPSSVLVQDGLLSASWIALLTACLAKLLFVYFDFSGYTDMARGTAYLFGIELPPNFNWPLFQPNLAEFWRNWHMSLSSFARDYVFFPVLVATRRPAFAIFSSMLVIAAWHGLQVGWMIWGAHHALGLIVLAAFQRRCGRSAAYSALRENPFWRISATLLTLYYVSSAYAWTWYPESPSQGLSIFLRIWSGGVFG